MTPATHRPARKVRTPDGATAHLPAVDLLDAATADLLLGVCVKRSFDRVSVDGQLSTNDTVILQASGASGVAVTPQSESEAIFGQALDAILRQLALLMVADGEGAALVGDERGEGVLGEAEQEGGGHGGERGLTGRRGSCGRARGDAGARRGWSSSSG